MEKTMTARDKALLLILGIIIIIFAGVMIPKVGNQPIGIYSFITDRSDTAKQIKTKETEKQEKMSELIKSGIDPRFVESAQSAKNNLQNKTLDLQHQAAKLSQTVDKETGYATARKWVEPVKYDNFVLGSAELLSNFGVKANKDGFSESSIVFGDVAYSVYAYEGEAECKEATDITFGFEADNYTNVEDIDMLAAYVVLTSQMARRGSIVVKGFDFDPNDTSNADLLNVPFDLYVPVGGKLSQYQVCECHECGTAYFVSEYERLLEEALQSDDPDVHCTNSDCEGIWDGIAIN